MYYVVACIKTVAQVPARILNLEYRHHNYYNICMGVVIHVVCSFSGMAEQIQFAKDK